MINEGNEANEAIFNLALQTVSHDCHHQIHKQSDSVLSFFLSSNMPFRPLIHSSNIF